MKSPFLCLLAVAGFVTAPVSSRAEMREWTRAADGKKIQAEFVGMKDESTVTIKMANGNTFDVPLSSLSAEDGAYVSSLAMKEDGDAPEEGAAPKMPDGEVSVTLTGVHLCCKECEDAILAAKDHEEVKVDPAVIIAVDRGAESVTVTAPDGKAAQTALRAIAASGFYGVSNNEAIKLAAPKEDEFTTDTMVVRNAHLCCRGCVRDFTKAVESVDGVDEVNAKEGADRVNVKGEGFKPSAVMAALAEAGFGGSFQ